MSRLTERGETLDQIEAQIDALENPVDREPDETDAQIVAMLRERQATLRKIHEIESRPGFQFRAMYWGKVYAWYSLGGRTWMEAAE